MTVSGVVTDEEEEYEEDEGMDPDERGFSVRGVPVVIAARLRWKSFATAIAKMKPATFSTADAKAMGSCTGSLGGRYRGGA